MTASGQLIQIQVAPSARVPANFHVVKGEPDVLLVVPGSRLFAAPGAPAAGFEPAVSSALPAPSVKLPPAPSAVSLNIAQTCNLSCSYCYADEGRFGGRPRMMRRDTARQIIDRLLAANRNGRLSIGFIGGEPLLNRGLIHFAARYAVEQAPRSNVAVSFSITTNGTLLHPTDIELFREHRFSVTISIDGSEAINDSHRRARRGSAFRSAVLKAQSLLREPGKARVAARCTLTRQNLDVAGRVRDLAEAGFPEIGVSPLRTSPTPGLALREEDWGLLLDRMREAAEIDWGRVQRGGSFRFSNLAIALKQLHNGACRPLPCGAAVSYVSVSAEGNYFTCHRTIGQAAFALGSLASGLDLARREEFAQSRLVDTQEPCRSCWARYLCGGGCHAEVIAAGREGCDYIRGWLEYCIRLYPHVLAHRADALGLYAKDKHNEP